MTAIQSIQGRPWEEFSTIESAVSETRTAASASILVAAKLHTGRSFDRFANCVGFLIGGATLGHFFGVFSAVIGGGLGLAAFAYVDRQKKKIGLW
jgi:hypothetical protein